MNFTLRPWKTEDLASLVRCANNYKIAKNMTNQFPHPYTTENGKAFNAYTSQGSPKNVLAIEINGEAVGSIGIHPQTDIYCKNAEMGYWLTEPFWGKGIVTKAIGQMLEYGFKNWDVNRIFARPFGINKASQRVLEKTGFVLEARFEKTFFKTANTWTN